jgi:hypothetical protein
MTKPTRSFITCAEVGCNNHIQYNPQEDIEVPLYCEKHRTESGRHSMTRSLRVSAPIPPKPPIPKVIFKCIKSSCKKLRVVSREDWMNGKEQVCGDCGSMMIYHKDIEYAATRALR